MTHHSKIYPTLTITATLLALLVLPALAVASGGGAEGHGTTHHGASLKEQGYYLINFIIFLWLLKIAAWDKIKAAMAARSDSIKSSIEEGLAAVNQASIRENEIRERLQAMPQELEALESTMKAQGEELARTIEQRAQAEKEKVEKAVALAIQGELEAAKRRLAREFAQITLDQTEAQLRQSRERLDQEALFAGFISNLKVEAQGRTGK